MPRLRASSRPSFRQFRFDASAPLAPPPGIIHDSAPDAASGANNPGRWCFHRRPIDMSPPSMISAPSNSFDGPVTISVTSPSSNNSSTTTAPQTRFLGFVLGRDAARQNSSSQQASTPTPNSTPAHGRMSIEADACIRSREDSSFRTTRASFGHERHGRDFFVNLKGTAGRRNPSRPRRIRPTDEPTTPTPLSATDLNDDAGPG